MSVDFSKPVTPETESPMFAATPAWDRGGKKRRGLSRSAAAPAPTATVTPPTPEVAETLAARPTGQSTGQWTVPGSSSTLVPPANRSAKAQHRSNVAPMAIALGAVAVAVIGVGAWYATQSRETGVAELTPGAPTDAVTVAAGPALPAPNPAVDATSTPAASPAPMTPTTAVNPVRPATPAPVRVARARPAPAAASVGEAGVNASDTLPAAPLPYAATVGADTAASTTAVNPAPAPVVSPTPGPVEATPAPAPPEIAPTAPTTPAPSTDSGVLP